MPDLRWLFASRIVRIALVLLLISVALSAINYASLPFAPCVEPSAAGGNNADNDATNKEHVCHEVRGIVLAGLHRLLDWSAAEWTAAATLLLAIYTGILATATRGQMKLTSDQVQLARDEFITTNRPLLRVRRFRLGNRSKDDDRMSASFVIVNVGKSDAILKDSKGGIDRVPPSVVPMPVYDGLVQFIEPDLTKPITLAPGTSRDGLIIDRPDAARGVTCRVYGYLLYEDRLGNVRTTGFCRHLNSATRAFDAVKDADSEYED